MKNLQPMKQILRASAIQKFLKDCSEGGAGVNDEKRNLAFQIIKRLAKKFYLQITLAYD